MNAVVRGLTLYFPVFHLFPSPTRTTRYIVKIGSATQTQYSRKRGFRSGQPALDLVFLPSVPFYGRTFDFPANSRDFRPATKILGKFAANERPVKRGLAKFQSRCVGNVSKVIPSVQNFLLPWKYAIYLRYTQLYTLYYIKYAILYRVILN